MLRSTGFLWPISFEWWKKATLLKILAAVSSIIVLWGMAGFFMDGEDEATQTADLIVVLGGGLAGERLQLACKLFAQGHGRKGVVLTGRNVETLVVDRARFIEGCGVPKGVLRHWSEVANSYQEMVAVKGALKQDGLKITISGHAQSNARISALMRNLEASPWLEQPQLIESKAVVQNGRRINEFGMNFVLTRIKPEDGKEKK